MLAAKHADIPYMQFLAEHGADPRIPTAGHATLLMVASGVGVFNVGESAGTNQEAFEATKLAWQLGSTDINAADDAGWTALHGAAKRGSNEIAQFLVEKGFSAFDAKTKEGWTPLRIADGVFVGATVKRADETAALIRKLMIERGLQPPAKVVNDVAAAADSKEK
jgi:ankyrin repeat protein